MNEISPPILAPGTKFPLHLSAFPPPQFEQTLSLIPGKGICLPLADNHSAQIPFVVLIPLMDGLLAKGPLLVHCERGVSRSVSAVVAYLVYKGLAFEEAFE